MTIWYMVCWLYMCCIGCLWLGSLIEFEIARDNIYVARGGIKPEVSHMTSVV